MSPYRIMDSLLILYYSWYQYQAIMLTAQFKSIMGGINQQYADSVFHNHQ